MGQQEMRFAGGDARNPRECEAAEAIRRPGPSICPKYPCRILLGLVVAITATAGALLIDCPLASWCVEDNCPGELARCFKVVEPFGHGLGVMLIALAIYQLDVRRRAQLPRVLTMSLGAGLLADVLKLLIVRTRPKEFAFHGGVSETFGSWLQAVNLDSSHQSFPSAHTATAVGLAIALSWLYPRGRWLFWGMAVFVALQRIESGYHYASDTIIGGAVGVLAAAACLKNGRIAPWFDGIERALVAKTPVGSEVDVEGARPCEGCCRLPQQERAAA